MSERLEKLIESVLIDGNDEFYEFEEERDSFKSYNRASNELIIYP